MEREKKGQKEGRKEGGKKIKMLACSLKAASLVLFPRQLMIRPAPTVASEDPKIPQGHWYLKSQVL